MVDAPKRVIAALDFEDKNQALAFIDKVDPRLCCLKVGLGMYTKYGESFVSLLQTKGFDVFLDLKFHDIPATVYSACKNAAQLGCWMVNVHALGGLDMLKRAREAIDSVPGKKPLLIGVTILTSMSQADIESIGLSKPVDVNVMHLAGLCREAGLDGVVCSPHEAAMIKQAFGQTFLTITPGIRFKQNEQHDQKRIMSPKEALKHGADFLVMGRSLVNDENPKKLLQALLQPE